MNAVDNFRNLADKRNKTDVKCEKCNKYGSKMVQQKAHFRIHPWHHPDNFGAAI